MMLWHSVTRVACNVVRPHLTKHSEYETCEQMIERNLLRADDRKESLDSFDILTKILRAEVRDGKGAHSTLSLV